MAFLCASGRGLGLEVHARVGAIIGLSWREGRHGQPWGGDLRGRGAMTARVRKHGSVKVIVVTLGNSFSFWASALSPAHRNEEGRQLQPIFIEQLPCVGSSVSALNTHKSSRVMALHFRDGEIKA